MKVLVIAAHPDDEVLGCGATAARLVAEGRQVHFAILGEGMTSRDAEREATGQAQLSALQGHARAAASKLGVKDVVLHKLPDNRLDTVPLLEVVKVVEELVSQIKPDVIYTPDAALSKAYELLTYCR